MTYMRDDEAWSTVNEVHQIRLIQGIHEKALRCGAD